MNTSADLLKELRIDRKAPPPEPTSRRGLWITLGVIAVLLALAAAGWALFGREKPIEVRTAPTVAMGNGGAAASVLDASGYVVARRMATVSAKITGKVREVLIEEGMKVDAGQVMATLDPVDADASRALSQAQVEAARSQVANVQAQLTEAEANARRLSSLVQQQLVARSQYDQAVAARDALRAQLQAAQRNVTVASRSLAISDNGVDNTIVRAPFAGVVIAKAAQPGEIVSPLATGGFTRTGIGTIVDMDSLEVEVEVNESFIGRVQPKMPIQATLNAYPDWQIPGEVIAIIPTADRSKATVKVRIQLASKDTRIVPDMGVRVSFLETIKPGAAKPTGVWVPTRAVQTSEGKSKVFVVEEDKVKSVAVTAGEVRDVDQMISAGLKGGETVVLSPPKGLKDGSRVTLKKE